MHNFKTSCCFTTFIVACILSSCSEEATTDILTSNDEIGFTAIYGDDNQSTRGAVIKEEKLGSFYVSAYAYALDESKTWDDYFDTSSSPNFIINEVVTKGTPWTTASNHYWPNTNMKMRFFGFANFEGIDKDHFKFSPSYTQITYKVPTEAENQNDIIAAVSDVETATYRASKESVPMHFHHIFTGIRFATSPATFEVTTDGKTETITNTIGDYKIISIGISNVRSEGTFTLKEFEYTDGEEMKDNASNLSFFVNRDNMWTGVDVSDLKTFTITSFENELLTPGMNITDGDNTLMMIPQTLTEDAVLVVTLEDKEGKEQTFSQPIKNLNQQGWGMGQMITYRIFTRETSVGTTFGLNYTVCPWDEKTVNIPSFN